MDYVDLGTLSTKSSRQRKKKLAFRVPKKFLGLLLILMAGWGVFQLLSSSPSTVLANFWSASGSVISYMLPGGARIRQEDGVTNILLVGIDRRANVPYSYQGVDGKLERNGFLADTIIVASVHHQTGQVSMLSIPRDLWVEIPAFGNLPRQYSKINASHALGDRFSGEENGGMLLLSRIVEDVLGIPIHYWARIDFVGFERGVDAIGGIDIIVDRPFDDYMYPKTGYENAPWDQRWEHVYFEAGFQHMDGATALKYARSRHAMGLEGTDFARARRQQKVIIAVKNKIVSSPLLFNPVKLKELYEIASDNLRTDIKLSEITTFFSLAKKFADQEIRTFSLTDEGLNLLMTPQDSSLYGNAWVLVPTAGPNNFSEIQQFVRESFYTSLVNTAEE